MISDNRYTNKKQFRVPTYDVQIEKGGDEFQQKRFQDLFRRNFGIKMKIR